MARVITVNDVLDGHVTLDIECLDRIYLNAYVPILQTSSQVVAFLSGHLGFPFPSPALFRQLGDRFRKAVLSFSDANDIPWIKFGKDEAKLEVMQPHLARQASTGRSGVAAIGVAQEFQRVRTAYEGKTSTGTPRWSFVQNGPAGDLLLLLPLGRRLRPGLYQGVRLVPLPGQDLAQRARVGQAAGRPCRDRVYRAAGGFAACEDPAALPAICDRLGPGTINVFTQRWLHRLPLPFGPEDHDAGYWWETSMRQVEISRTIVFDAPSPRPRLLRGTDRGQPRHRPPAQRGDHLRPQDPPRHQGGLPHRDRPAATTAASWSMSSASTRGSSSTSRTAGRCGSRPPSAPPATWAERPPAQPGRTPGQGRATNRRILDAERAPGHRPCEPSL